MTKADLVKQFGLKNFDYALPQSWVDAARERGFDVVPHFVWSYDDDPHDMPHPLTNAGQSWSAKWLNSFSLRCGQIHLTEEVTNLWKSP